MFNKKLQTQEVQVDQTLPLNDQPLPVDWTSRVQSMVYILKGARGDFVVCIMLHQKKKSPYRKKKRCCLILTQKFSGHALRLSETHGSDLKIVMPCCFLKNLFGGAFYVIPGCGFLEVLEIKNLVETPLAMTIRKTRWIVGYDVCRSSLWTGWLWFCPSGWYSLVN